jgi:hypothetical protein
MHERPLEVNASREVASETTLTFSPSSLQPHCLGSNTVTFSAAADDIANIRQFKAAQFLRQAESKGNKTLGNTWYVQSIFAVFWIWIWLERLSFRNGEGGARGEPTSLTQTSRCRHPIPLQSISYAHIPGAINHRNTTQTNPPVQSSAQQQHSTHPHPTSFNAAPPSLIDRPTPHAFRGPRPHPQHNLSRPLTLPHRAK